MEGANEAKARETRGGGVERQGNKGKHDGVKNGETQIREVARVAAKDEGWETLGLARCAGKGDEWSEVAEVEMKY